MKTFRMCAGTLILGAALAFAAHVTADYNHATDFSQFHTYSWLKVSAGDQLWQDRITSAVDQQLAAKGWQKVSGGGDVAVSAFGSTKDRPTLNTFYDGLGGGWFWGGWDGMATTTVENQKVGTLTVDLFNTRDKHLIWRGTASEVLSSKPEKNDKKLDDAVAEMFKKFPTKPKG